MEEWMIGRMDDWKGGDMRARTHSSCVICGLLQFGLTVYLERSMPPDNRRTADSSNQSQERYNAERD
jgi:hypothetical protein